MYFSEILLIGIISIAIGLGTGVGLFYLLFKCIGSWIIKTSFSINKLTVDINVLYLVFIVILIVAIIFIASAVNAIKCITGNNIDKIRKVKDIKSKKVANKNRYLSVEWNIVLKSFFRYNKKYRYTIIALLLSVVLFISCGSFNAYADYYIKELLPVAGYDIQINSRQSDIYTIIEQQYGIFSQIEELTDSGWISMLPAGYIMLSDVETDDFYRDYATNHNIDKVDVTYTFIDDNSFNTLCNLENKDFSQYYTDTGRVLVYDNLNCYINGEQYALRFFKNSYNQFNLLYMNSKNLDEYYSTNLFDGNYYEKNILAEVISKDNFSIELKSISDQNGIFFILPISMLNCFSEDVPTSVQMYFSADNYSLVAQEIEEIKNSNNWNVSIDKVAERYDKERNTYALYELFMIVFTILISFVSIVNTYNSVTSNLISRKKEFAVMQSIGLSKVSYIKIVLNECILISGVVLSCSIILSIAVSWILSLSFALDNYIFYYPWKYFLLASICLIVIILSSIIMPAYKIKNQNIIKTIKEDMN
jgi:putative ABC transport system permease protein